MGRKVRVCRSTDSRISRQVYGLFPVEHLESRRLLSVGGNTPPVAIIDLPAMGSEYHAGQTIQFSGSATDAEQGTLPASAFEWSVVFHHDTHTHPFLHSIPGVTSGSFEIPLVYEVDPDQWFRIHLTVTDNGGLQDATFVNILPVTAQVTIETAPPGLEIDLDGQPRPAPFTFVGVAGMPRQLAALSNQFFNGQWYEFLGWSDQGQRIHDIITPTVNTTYRADYELDLNGPFVRETVFRYSGNTLPAPPHELRISFSENVIGSIGVNDLLLENLSLGTTVSIANIQLEYDWMTNTAIFTFPGFTNGVLPDGNYRATLLAPGILDPAGHPMVSNHVGTFFVLAGDANHDGRVNLADFNILAANFGQSPRDFTQGDFNYDGLVNLADFNILASRFGTSVAPVGAGARSNAGSVMRPPQFSIQKIFEDGDEEAVVEVLN